MDSKSAIDKLFLAKDLGFESELEFYEKITVHDKVHKVMIPTLSINSSDDMVCPIDCIPIEEIEENPNMIQVNTVGGGHIEFFQGLRPKMASF